MPQLFPASEQLGLPQTTAHGVPYEIESVLPGPREDYVPNANRTMINTRIFFQQTELWTQDMVGTVAFNSNFNTTPGFVSALTRTIPQQCPFAPTGNYDPSIGGIGGQWCTRIEQNDSGGSWLDGLNAESGRGPIFDPSSGWPLPQYQRHRCTFEGLPYSILSDAAIGVSGPDAFFFFAGLNAPEMSRYVIRSRRPKVREQQIPLGQLYIAGSVPPGPAKLLPNVGPFVRLASADVQYTWVRVPVNCIPTATLILYENCINFGVWDTVNPGGYSWPDGTLRFAGYDDTNRYQDATGIWVCDLIYYFEYRNVGLLPTGQPAGWNYAFLPSTLGGSIVGVTTDGKAVTPNGGGFNCLYLGRDFNQLFWPQAA